MISLGGGWQGKLKDPKKQKKEGGRGDFFWGPPLRYQLYAFEACYALVANCHTSLTSVESYVFPLANYENSDVRDHFLFGVLRSRRSGLSVRVEVVLFVPFVSCLVSCLFLNLVVSCLSKQDEPIGCRSFRQCR